jgi:hypothetical protein
MKRMPALITVLLLASSAFAQLWSVTTADFRRQDGVLERLAPAGVLLRESGSTNIPWDQIVSLEQKTVRQIRSADRFVLYTRDGQKLKGMPIQLGDENLTWRSSVLGEIRVPLDGVVGWAVAGAEPPSGGGQEDTVVLQNGDTVHGVIEPVQGGISLAQGTSTTPITWDGIKSVALAKVGSSGDSGGSLRLRLADGSTCLASAVELSGERLRIRRGDGSDMEIPAAAVESIQNEGGVVRFIASLKPAEVRYTPYTQISEDPPAGVQRLDQVKIGDAVFGDVIQLRPRASVVVAAPFDGRLHARYACGNAGRYTDMTFKVIVGSSAVFEAKDIRSPEPGPAIDAPVKKGEPVRFELDYGQNFDVQDYLWLIEAAFVQG